MERGTIGLGTNETNRMGKLIFIDDKHAGRVYKLVLEKTTVGRSENNLLVIQDNSVSAHHCEILMNGSEIIVRDLDSRNGTLVNGTRLRNQQTQLKHGQTVRFGSVEARLELEEIAFGNPDDSATGITAVHAMGRIMTQQRRDRAKGQEEVPSIKLGSESGARDNEQTVTSLSGPGRPNRSASPSPAPAADEHGAQVSARRSQKALTIAIIILALGLVALVWLLNRGE